MKQTEYQWIQLVSCGIPKVDAAAQVFRGCNPVRKVAQLERNVEVSETLERFQAFDAVNAAMVRKSVADTMTCVMIDAGNKPGDRLKAAEGLMKLYRLGEEVEDNEDRKLFRELLRANLPGSLSQDP